MEICTPAFVYLVLEVLSVIVLIIKNAGSLALLIKIAVIALWTWLLNFLCKNGYTVASWVLLVLPFIFTIILIILNIIVLTDVIHDVRHDLESNLRYKRRNHNHYEDFASSSHY